MRYLLFSLLALAAPTVTFADRPPIDPRTEPCFGAIHYVSPREVTPYSNGTGMWIVGPYPFDQCKESAEKMVSFVADVVHGQATLFNVGPRDWLRDILVQAFHCHRDPSFARLNGKDDNGFGGRWFCE